MGSRQSRAESAGGCMEPALRIMVLPELKFFIPPYPPCLGMRLFPTCIFHAKLVILTLFQIAGDFHAPNDKDF